MVILYIYIYKLHEKYIATFCNAIAHPVVSAKNRPSTTETWGA